MTKMLLKSMTTLFLLDFARLCDSNERKKLKLESKSIFSFLRLPRWKLFAYFNGSSQTYYWRWWKRKCIGRNVAFLLGKNTAFLRGKELERSDVYGKKYVEVITAIYRIDEEVDISGILAILRISKYLIYYTINIKENKNWLIKVDGF